MQYWELRVSELIDHAATEHGDREIVTHWADGSESRTTWSGIRHDALRMVQALRRLGIKPGDRVATLAMNHNRHLVTWYGATGAGAVLHTINPRLFDEQLDYIVTHAEDRVLIFDAMFAPIVERLKANWPCVEHFICFDSADHGQSFDDWIDAEDGQTEWTQGSERERTVLLPEKVEAIYETKYGDRNGVKPLTHMDGAYHREHRNVTMDWFGPKHLRKFEPQIARIAKEFVDRMEDFGDACDFSADIAYWFPLRVVMTLMGVPKEDEAHVLRLTQRLFSPADKDLKTRDGEKSRPASDGMRDVFAEFGDYYAALTEDRRKNPRDDIISTIANGVVNGCPMADREMTSYYVIASTAGHDTTAASIGGGLLGLLQFPEQFDKLRADPGLLNLAAEEFVRWTAPVKHFMRTPRRDVTWHDVTVAAGETIMLCYPSACRDEKVFGDADRFRVDRPSNPAHLAFGYGPHFCLGKFLATMEIRAFYTELLPRLKHMELAGHPTFIESTFVSGLKSLPIRFTFR